MKKTILTFLLLCLAALQTIEASDIWVEGKAAWFEPTSGSFRKRYGGNCQYGGEITVPFIQGYYWDGFALFLSGDYYSKRRRARFCEDFRKTDERHNKFQIVPVALGFKYFFSLPCFCNWLDMDLYVGAGGVWNFVREQTHRGFKEHSRHKEHSRNKQSFGGVYKVGGIINLPCNWFLDLFVNYNDSRVRLGDHDKRDFRKRDHITHHDNHRRHHSRKTNISGWVFGGGIGYDFSLDSCCCN